MCNRYVSPDEAAIERHWQLRRTPGLGAMRPALRGGPDTPAVAPGPTMPWPRRDVFPRAPGVFVRALRSGGPRSSEPAAAPTTSDDTEQADRLWTGEVELAVGQWALVPWFAKTPKLTYSTNNCRWETAASAASFKQAWSRSQRCIIPAELFYEPNWESGKNEWWAFRRADGAPWGLAGLWDIWLDKASGELVESYTMLTMNADAHPLMKRMHKPDPSVGPDQQDKRSVVVLERSDWDTWLHGTPVDAASLVRLAPADVFDAGPMPP